jgi:hypothetical protein
MIEGYLQLVAHLARPADVGVTDPQRNAGRLIGDESRISPDVAFDARPQKRVPPLQRVENLTPRRCCPGPDERRAHDEVKRRSLIVEPEEFLERAQSGGKRVRAKSSCVHESQHIDVLDASLFLPCRDLAQDAKMKSPPRSICAARRAASGLVVKI